MVGVSERRKERLIEVHRYLNVDFEWWEFITDQWADKLGGLGIVVDWDKRFGRARAYPTIYFSGFGSQGDGASFTGTLVLARFFEAHPEIAAAHPLWVEEAARYPEDVHGRLTRTSSRYSHENTVGLELFNPQTDLPEEPVTAAVVTARTEALDEQAGPLEEAALEQCRDYMRQIYKELEAEHDHLTSDEQVWESIVANGLDEEDEEDE